MNVKRGLCCWVAMMLWVGSSLAGLAEDESSGFAPADESASGRAKIQPLTGKQLFVACQGCHSLQKGAAHKVGPNLYGIHKQSAARYEDFAYSEGLKSSGIIWNKGSLLGWVLSAETMVANTWMLYHNQLSVAETQRLVDYIVGYSE